MSSLIVQFGDAATAVEGRLRDILDRQLARGAPERLVAAMRHAALGGGKRFRPFLLINAARLFDVSPDQALTAAAAVECIHCYSLVHDDLPSMDNDDLRRGQPTVWRAFDEWTAILAGDALQALAFELLASPSSHEIPAVRAELVLCLAEASGAIGMVGGQLLDLEAESAGDVPGAEHVARLQAMKTGCLIAAACEMGGILGRADPARRAALKRYGQQLGLAFQISDDLLDAEGHATTVGKATGKDAAAGKATLVGLYGIGKARRELDVAVADAIKALAPFGTDAEPLVEAARFMALRRS